MPVSMKINEGLAPVGPAYWYDIDSVRSMMATDCNPKVHNSILCCLIPTDFNTASHIGATSVTFATIPAARLTP